MKKHTLQENYERLFGPITEDMKGVANQIKSAATPLAKKTGYEKPYIWKLKPNELKNWISNLKSGSGQSKNKVLAKWKAGENFLYVAIEEMSGFLVFEDGSIFLYGGTEGGDSWAVPSRNWKKEMVDRFKELEV